MAISLEPLVQDYSSGPPILHISRQSTDSTPSMVKKRIINMYCNEGEVSIPKDTDLESDFSSINQEFQNQFMLSNSETITKIRGVLQNDHYESSQKVPETADGIYKYIAKQTTPYEPRLMHLAMTGLDGPIQHTRAIPDKDPIQQARAILDKEPIQHAVEVLDKEPFQSEKTKLFEYESKLNMFFQSNSLSCQQRRVPIPVHTDHTHMAVVISEEQVLLSLMLKMKEYFSKYLQLEKTLFQGFETSSTCNVLFFSIPRVDAALLSPKVLSHLSELKRMFGMTHLIVFGYFACDLQKAIIDSEVFDKMTITAVCIEELRDKIHPYVQAVHDLVQHRDTGMSWFCEAAKDLDKAFKHVAAAKIAGSSLGIAGGILGVVGGGLLLGGVTAPAGIAVLVVGAVVGVSGGITGVGATIGDVVKNRRTLRRANEWIHEGSKLCEDLIKKHEDYHQELHRVCRQFCKSEQTVIQTALGQDHIWKNDVEFIEADRKVEFVISDWKKALEMGAEATATAFVTGAHIAGAVTRGVVGGVEAGAEAGATVARVAVQAAGGVVIGLSAVFMVVDLALIGKTAYDLKKNKKGTELANKLRQAADDMEKETAQLRPLANFANDI